MISERICKARQQAGLSQKQAAKLLQTHHKRIEKMEDGKFNPTFREIEKMAKTYEVSTAYIKNGTFESMLDELAEHHYAPEGVKIDIFKKWGAHSKQPHV